MTAAHKTKRVDRLLVAVLEWAVVNKRTAASLAAGAALVSNVWSHYAGKVSAEQAARAAAFSDHRAFMSNAVVEIRVRLDYLQSAVTSGPARATRRANN